MRLVGEWSCLLLSGAFVGVDGSVCTWEVHSGFLGDSGTEGEQSWLLAQPEQQLESISCKNGRGEGKDLSLAISITESQQLACQRNPEPPQCVGECGCVTETWGWAK